MCRVLPYAPWALGFFFTVDALLLAPMQKAFHSATVSGGDHGYKAVAIPTNDEDVALPPEVGFAELHLTSSL